MNKRFQIISPTVHVIILAAFSLLCSLLLWVYVVETRGEDIPRQFPGVEVVFDGESTIRESRELVLVDPSANSVSVSLTGNRRTLSALDSADLSVVVDISRITRTGEYSYAPSIRYPSRTDTSAISSVSIEPEVIGFYVDKLEHKTLEVKGINNGSAAEGYAQDPLSFEPSTVIVYGPAWVLEDVVDAFVEVNLTDLDRTRTISSTYILRDAEGNEVVADDITQDTDLIDVTVPIKAVRDVSLVVEMEYGGGVTADNVKWDLEPNRITLTGDSETLAGINSITVARVNLSLITENSYSDTYLIPIPNDTQITSGGRETKLSLELGGLTKQVFQIPKERITCINVSEGYVADIGNDSLEVTLRGTEENLRSVRGQSVRAVADLTEYGTATGSVSVPVRVIVDGSQDVGAVGEYEVLVNIREAGTETEDEATEARR